MANEMTTPRATGVGALSALRSALQTVRASIPDAGGMPYLRLLTDGAWVFGKDDYSIEPGTEAVVNIASMQHGFTCWTNKGPKEGKNDLLGEVMVPIGRAAPSVLDLPSHPYPWKTQYSVNLKIITGAHANKEVHFKTSSVGGTNALSALMDAMLERMEDPAETYVFPVVALSSSHYNHSSYGRTYTPVMEIVGWANEKGEEEGEEAPAPKAVAAPKAEPKPAATVTPATLRAGRASRAAELVAEEPAQEEDDLIPLTEEAMEQAVVPARRRRT